MKNIMKFIKPYGWGILIVAVLVFAQAMLELFLPNLMAQIVDQGIAVGNIPYIWQVGGQMLLVTIASAVAVIIVSYLSAQISSKFARDIRGAIFKKVESFAPSEYDKFGAASLITRTTNDVTQLQMVAMMLLRIVLMAPIMCVGGIIMAVSKNASLSLTVVVAIPFLFLLIAYLGKSAMPISKVLQKKIDRVNLVMREKLIGIRVIRAFNREDYERKRFDEANLDLTGISTKLQRLMSVLMPGLMLILNVTTIAVVWFGGGQINAGNMQVGDLMAFIQYVMQIMMSMTMLSMVFVMLPRASASISRINEVLNTELSIVDPAQPKNGGQQRGYIEFQDVTFRYPDADETSLEHISFSAKPGETTAIIGSTGSGKSTLIQLIPRFYEIQEGQILIDGVDIKDYNQKDLRAKIGFIPQKAILFSGTIADNIRQGKPDATEQELEAAAVTAQAIDFIQSKPERFDSEIAQGGTNVSGGQKQRLSIARALVRKPEIYIFDDSFSALDFKTDAALRKALKKETGESTVIIVAQRVSTVMDADRILVLDEGKMVGAGAHAQLMKDCDIYREIVSSQMTEEEMA